MDLKWFLSVNHSGTYCAKVFLPGMVLLWLNFGVMANNGTLQKQTIVDSLKNVCKSNISQKQKFNALLKLSDYYQFKSADSNYYYGHLALTNAYSRNDVNDEVSAYNSMIDGFLSHAVLDSVWKYMNAAMQLAKTKGDFALRSTENFYFGNVYERLHKRDSSLFHYLRAKELINKTNDHIAKATIMHGIAQFYIRQKDYDKALPILFDAYKLRYKKDSLELTGLLSDLGNVYFAKKEYKTAMQYYQKALQECKEKNAWWAFGYTLNNIALVYEKEGDFENAEYNYLQSLHYYSLNKNNTGLANTSGNLARLYFDRKKYDLALNYALAAVREGEDIQDYKILSDNYFILSSIYEKIGNYKEALAAEKNANKYMDSLQNAEQRDKTTDLQIRYETSQKEIENQKLKQRASEEELYSKRQTQIAVFISVLLLLSLLSIYLINRKNRQQQKLNTEISAQKKELEKTNMFKSKLFSIISHDFRAPLTTLSGLLYLIQQDMLTKEELLSTSNAMQEQLNATTAFLDNMLFWAQSQLTGYKQFIHPMNVHITVMEILSLYLPTANSKNISMLNKTPADLEVDADANLVRLVLRNFISNAIKYTTAGHISIYSALSPGELKICVKDDGIGVPSEIRATLFTEIRQSRDGTNNEKGTGLGLALCREFLEANGGRIWLEDSTGPGSSFCFSVPVL